MNTKSKQEQKIRTLYGLGKIMTDHDTLINGETKEIIRKYLIEHKEDFNQAYEEQKDGSDNDSYEEETISLTHDSSMSEYDGDEVDAKPEAA